MKQNPEQITHNIVHGLLAALAARLRDACPGVTDTNALAAGADARAHDDLLVSHGSAPKRQPLGRIPQQSVFVRSAGAGAASPTRSAARCRGRAGAVVVSTASGGVDSRSGDHILQCLRQGF